MAKRPLVAFDIVDTGGIEPTADSEILLFMREQAEIAINSADVIVFVTEIGTGVTAADQEVAAMLKRSHKPVVLCVNKMDSVGQVDPGIYEFYSLGLGDPIALSAIHGHGTDEMLDALRRRGRRVAVRPELPRAARADCRYHRRHGLRKVLARQSRAR